MAVLAPSLESDAFVRMKDGVIRLYLREDNLKNPGSIDQRSGELLHELIHVYQYVMNGGIGKDGGIGFGNGPTNVAAADFEAYVMCNLFFGFNGKEDEMRPYLIEPDWDERFLRDITQATNGFTKPLTKDEFHILYNKYIEEFNKLTEDTSPIKNFNQINFELFDQYQYNFSQ